MKQTSIKMNGRLIACILLAVVMSATFSACSKNEGPKPGPMNLPAKYSSDVIDKWITMQLRLMRNATGIQNQAFSRHFVYAGLAALESLSPGIPTHHTYSKKWNGLNGMLPAGGHATSYYYPANVNAALATINRALFPAASAADKTAIDSLENALKQEFLTKESQTKIDISSQYGKDVATAVFNWSETDGYKNASAPYTAPVGDGLWVPTAPAFAAPASPYWGNNRTIVKNSTENTQPVAPIAFSAETKSAFYQMVKEVYDASQTLTDDQKAMAMFWRDVPGVSSPGHWLSILQQVMRKVPNTGLDRAAFAYAFTGAAINDALIACWKSKYQYNLVRPITYIRNVMGFQSWNAHLGTPAHPEYPSAHSSLSAAAAGVMQDMFGNIGSFTDHTYDYLGFAPRTYYSLTAIANEAGLSRWYAGIHYLPSIDAGLKQGKKVADNIFDNNNSSNE